MYIPEPKNVPHKASEWLEMLRNNKVKLDLGFQSRKRWDKTDKRLYLYNFVQNIAPSPIVVCHVQDSLDDLNKEKFPGDYEYFEKLQKEGYIYVIIDGNNRDQTLVGFFEGTDLECLLPGAGKRIKGKVDLTEGYGPDDIRLPKDHSFQNLIDGRYTWLEKYIADRNVQICEYKVTSVTQLGAIFDAIQRGKTLNDQERRNCWISITITAKIRELSTRYEDILLGVVGKASSGRRMGDELIAKFHHYVTYENKHLTKTSIDDLYIFNQDSRWNTTVKYVDWTLGVLKKLGNSAKAARPAHVLDLFDLVMFLDKSSIKRERDFHEWWLGTLLKLKDSKLRDPLYFEKWYIGSKDINDPDLWTKDSNTGEYLIDRWTYHDTVNEAGKASGRPQRLEHWIKLLMEDTETNNNLITYTDKQRLYTSGQTFQIWLNQDKKEVSGRNAGRDIPIAHLLDKSMYQTDHINKHRKGNPTTIENGEVMSVERHREKTAAENRKVPVTELETIAA